MNIKKDQLEKIQNFQKDLNKLLNEVGFLEAQKTAVLSKFHEILKTVLTLLSKKKKKLRSNVICY